MATPAFDGHQPDLHVQQPDPGRAGRFELLRNGKPSHVKLNITPQPDGQTYMITFGGPGVIGGSLPDGNYTLITLANKVHVCPARR